MHLNDTKWKNSFPWEWGDGYTMEVGHFWSHEFVSEENWRCNLLGAHNTESSHRAILHDLQVPPGKQSLYKQNNPYQFRSNEPKHPSWWRPFLNDTVWADIYRCVIINCFTINDDIKELAGGIWLEVLVFNLTAAMFSNLEGGATGLGKQWSLGIIWYDTNGSLLSYCVGSGIAHRMVLDKLVIVLPICVWI